MTAEVPHSKENLLLTHSSTSPHSSIRPVSPGALYSRKVTLDGEEVSLQIQDTPCVALQVTNGGREAAAMFPAQQSDVKRTSGWKQWNVNTLWKRLNTETKGFNKSTGERMKRNKVAKSTQIKLGSERTIRQNNDCVKISSHFLSFGANVNQMSCCNRESLGEANYSGRPKMLKSLQYDSMFGAEGSLWYCFAPMLLHVCLFSPSLFLKYGPLVPNIPHLKAQCVRFSYI